MRKIIQLKSNKQLFKKSGLLLIALSLSLLSYSVTKTSTGNGNWSNASSWSPSGVPAANDSIIINHAIVLDQDIELTAGGKLTINSGASLIGNISTRRIGYTLSNTGPSVRVTNYGTLTIGRYNRSASGGNSNDDQYFDNYGTFNLSDNIDCNGSASAFAMAWGVFTNHAGAVINASPCVYIGGGTSQAEFHNSGEIFFNCSTCSNAFAAHSTSTIINHPGGHVTAVELMTMGGLDQHNYGCINALGGIRVFEKTSNGGNGTFTLHDNSKIFVPSGQQFNINANTTLIGIDDDNNNANNACVSTQTQVTNNGTISGEFYLNDPDGIVSGTVGSNVVLGTGNCGGGCTVAACAISSVTATPGACNSGNNQYTLTGAVTFSNAPSSGTMTITVSGGGSQVFTAPFTSPTSYSISGLISDGVAHNVDVVFSADANCTGNTSFTAPASCVTSGCTGGAFTYPNFQTLGWQSSPLACGTNNGNISQLFNNYLGSGVGATFTYSTNMWDGDAPNLYLASPASGGCDNQFNTTIDDQHCASNYHGALRFTNNNLSSGETFVEVSFSSPVYLDLARVGSISRLSGGNYEWLHVIAYDANNTIVPISTSNMVGGYMDCSNNITSGGMNFIADGAGGVYVNPTAIILQSNGLYGHADITIPNVTIQKLRFEHWAAPSTTDHTLRASVYSSVIMNVLCVSPACVKPNAGSNITALPGSCYNLTGSNPTTGLWNPLAGNPTGATLGTTVNGTAQVCFANTAVGVFGFTYSISTGCEDTMYVTINPVIAQPCANTTLWAINEDNGHLFSVSNWSTQSGVNTTTTDWGLIKWSSDNCATSTNINNSGGSELESAAWDPITNEYYFTSNKSLGSFNAPVLLKIKINDLVNGQQPCATVIGSIAAGGQDIESLAIDPATGDLYGGSKAGGDLYKFNKTTAAIISGYPVQMTKPGGGNLNDAESLTFDYSGNLYVSETDDKDVYIINPVTGAGISTFDNNTAPLGLDGLTWDFVGNRLIGFEDNSANGFSNLYEITPGNGSNILLANTFAAGLVDIEGLEFGCQKLTCLGNRVWNDVDEDGIQDASEVGVSGVTVTLYSSTNQILGVTNTDAYGYYSFCQLHPGAYTVGFTLPANYVFSPANSTNDGDDSDADPLTGLTGVYTLVAGDSNMTVDAGIYQPLPITATVGDRVWFDANSNGLQDVGESGVSGITVSLYNCTNPGVPVATTITDANGNYLFENVIPGNYQVSFSVPLGMLITTQSGVVSDANNSDVNPLTERTACFTVNGGDNITYVDAGLKTKPALTSSIGDKLWNDANQNGVQEANETGVQGVTVTMYEQDGITVLATTTTDGLGNYAFNGINAGCYVIGFSNLPSGYTFSPMGLGSDTSKNSDANTGTGKTGIICISAGQNNPTIDAGIYNASNTNSIGDRVWYDANQNGLQDGPEYGYPGVVVTLYDCTTNTIVATTTTNSNGNYLFDGLANGDYYVGFGFIPGYQFTSANSDASGVLGANNSDANPSSGLTACVTLSGNTNITTVDAGIYEGNGRTATSSLGDLVWVDANNNGLQDAGEPGVSGVTATLVDANTNTTLASTITDGLGNYIFTNLTGGLYRVEFSNIPAGYTFTTQSGSIEDELNSDANAGTGITSNIPLGLGEDKMSVDAGIVPPASTVCLGDYVWFDLNNNGVQDGNEPQVPGVTVKLYDNNTNTVLQVTTTNRQGKYLFCGLSNGNTYSVGFENLPAGYEFTVSNGALSVNDNSDANPTTGRTTTVTLGSTDDLTLDAGIYSTTTAVVGNYVWYDEDADGIQDATEAPIPGVLVTLYDNTNTPVSSAVTDANGGYLFTNVTPGNYVIGFSGYPGSLVPTSKGSNASADDDSNIDPNTGLTDVFTVTPGSSNLTLDAGYKANPVAGLGNYVWHDLNENGLQDPTEAPISGVVVTLYASDGTTPLGTAITDGNGAYSFPNLTAGSYIVGFSNLPNGYTRTRIIGVLNDALNSDINANNQTALITLSAGTYNPNIDAGFYMGVPLGARELVATLVKQQGTNQAIVNWYTKDEENTATFEIQRSTNGSDYTQVGTKAAGGNTQGQTNYSAIDDISGLEKEAVIYYRIKLIDIDAQQKYSNTISLKLGTTTNGGVLVHPIPFTNRLTVTYVAEMDENITLELLDMSGRVIARSEKPVTKGLNNAVLENLESLSSSQYLLRIVPSGDGETQVIRVNK